MQKKITVGITQGDSNGVGYEVIIKSLADSRINDLLTPVIYGSSKMLGLYKKMCSGIDNLNIHITQSASDLHFKMVNLIPCVPDTLSMEPGKVTDEGANAAIIALNRAVADLKAGTLDVLVTAPFNKSTVNKAGFAFPGHTEYLANAFGCQDALMLLCCHDFKVGVVTGHIPLKDVASSLTQDLILHKIQLMAQTLQMDFNVRQPKIAVLGLNPHAGDAGLLGNEEQQVIIPAIERANAEGIMAFGPYPSDSFFANVHYRSFDAVLAMYHDQGLIPFKAISFNHGVNYTGGLPVVRTSPDHGTAYDLAGKDQASPESMLSAIYAACDIFRSRQRNKEMLENRLKTSKLEGGNAG